MNITIIIFYTGFNKLFMLLYIEELEGKKRK